MPTTVYANLASLVERSEKLDEDVLKAIRHIDQKTANSGPMGIEDNLERLDEVTDVLLYSNHQLREIVTELLKILQAVKS